jgi:hypothetical protein
VDPSEIVAGRVLAEREKLVVRDRRDGHDVAVVRSGAVVASAARARAEIVHTGSHDDLGGIAELHTSGRETERIRDPDHGRSDGEATAPIGRDAVRGSPPLAPVECRGQESRGPAAVIERIGHGDLRRGAASGDFQVHPCVGPHVHARGSDGAVQLEGERTASGPQHRTHDEGQGRQAQRGEFGRAQEAAGDEESDCCAE